MKLRLCFVTWFLPSHIWRILGWLMILVSGKSMTELKPPHDDFIADGRRLHCGKEWGEHSYCPSSLLERLTWASCILDQRSWPLLKWTHNSLSLQNLVNFLFSPLGLKSATAPLLLVLSYRTILILIPYTHICT